MPRMRLPSNNARQSQSFHPVTKQQQANLVKGFCFSAS
uniref:Uncharacterized protein n=1 Tax=Rhizophora mucronata TaxID=61149 RepID=A0A2P2LTU2_RHIMU